MVLDSQGAFAANSQSSYFAIIMFLYRHGSDS